MLAREPATEACSSVNPTVVPESLRLVQAHVVDVPSSSLVVLLHRPTEGTPSVVPHRLILEIRVLDKTARDQSRSFKDALLRFPAPHPTLEEIYQDDEPGPLPDQGWQIVYSRRTRREMSKQVKAIPQPQKE
jgi:hypothetical protein